MPHELKEAVIGLREQDALAITDRLLAGGADPLAIVASCKEAMDEIGRRFSCGEAFIPELIMAGEIMKGITARVKPRLAARPAGGLGRHRRALHRQGRHPRHRQGHRRHMLDIAGFRVVDLGVDVALPRRWSRRSARYVPRSSA